MTRTPVHAQCSIPISLSLSAQRIMPIPGNNSIAEISISLNSPLPSRPENAVIIVRLAFSVPISPKVEFAMLSAGMALGCNGTSARYSFTWDPQDNVLETRIEVACLNGGMGELIRFRIDNKGVQFASGFSRFLDGIVQVDIICPDKRRPESALGSTSCYPNPVTEKLWLRSEVGLNHCQLINVEGEVVTESRLDGTTKDFLPVEQLDPGIYFLLLKLENGDYHKEKILVK